MDKFTHIKTPWFKPCNFKAITHADGQRFYYDPKITPRIYYPSVTTVLQDYKKDILDKWRKRVGKAEAFKIAEKARVRGDAFHEMAERYIKNEDPAVFTPNFESYHRATFNRVRRLLDQHVNNIHIQEQPLFSAALGIAGRVDLVAEWDGILSIIDFKGSNKLKKAAWIDNYFMQAAGYAMMYWEMTNLLPKQTVVIISGDDHSMKPYIESPAKWIKPLKNEISKFKKNFVGRDDM